MCTSVEWKMEEKILNNLPLINRSFCASSFELRFFCPAQIYAKNMFFFRFLFNVISLSCIDRQIVHFIRFSFLFPLFLSEEK